MVYENGDVYWKRTNTMIGRIVEGVYRPIVLSEELDPDMYAEYLRSTATRSDNGGTE